MAIDETLGPVKGGRPQDNERLEETTQVDEQGGPLIDLPPEDRQKIQEDSMKFVNKGTMMIHSEQSRDQILEMIGSGQNPLESVADATVMVVQRVDEAARQAGEEVHDMVKLQAAIDLTEQIAEVGAASGKIPELSPEQLNTSLSVGIQKFLQGEIEAGRIDPEGLKAELTQGIKQMPREQQLGLHKELQGINQTALASTGQTAAGQQILQEVNQTNGGLL
jgi:hypothetical protein